MNHVLAEHGLCLTYLCDPHSIDELDQDNILEDLSDDTPTAIRFPGLPDAGCPTTITWFWSPIRSAVVTSGSSQPPMAQRRATASCCWRRHSSPRLHAART